MSSALLVQASSICLFRRARVVCGFTCGQTSSILTRKKTRFMKTRQLQKRCVFNVDFFFGQLGLSNIEGGAKGNDLVQVNNDRGGLCFFGIFVFCVSGILLNQASPNSCKHKPAPVLFFGPFQRWGAPPQKRNTQKALFWRHRQRRQRRKTCQPHGW